MTRPRPRHGRLVATLGGLLILTAIAAVWTWRTGRAGDAPAPRVVPLTTLDGPEMATSFSPDGEQVAFAWNGEKQDTLDLHVDFDIYVKTIGSSDVRRLTTRSAPDRWPAWSPDGRQIAYVSQDLERDRWSYGLRVMTSLGGSDRKLGDVRLYHHAQIAWSPDSRHVAAGVVAGDPRERNGILLIPVAGGEPRPLTRPEAPGADQAPAFSPDGRRLAYASCTANHPRTSCDVYVLDLGPSFSATTPPRRLTRQAMGHISGLAWGRDGTFIVYDSGDVGNLNYLWRVRADGNSPPERIETAGLNSAFPSTAPSSDRLAFTRVVMDIDIYRFQPGSSSRALLSSSLQDSNPQISPDGRRIAFCSNRSGEAMEVWAAAADGTGAEQLTNGPGRWQGSPHWSPDGRQIAFDSRAEDGTRHIWAIDADGGTPRQITRHEGDQVIPTWSRDGRWIYFSWAQGAGRDIWRIPAAGGAAQRVTSDGGARVGHESPDGKSLLYVSLVDGSQSLRAVPLAGGPARQVLACVDGTSVAVGPDSLYYVACGSGDAEVHVMNWAARDDRLLGTLEGAQRNWIPSSFSVSPDGSAVLYQRTIAGGMDLMLIENFR